MFGSQNELLTTKQFKANLSLSQRVKIVHKYYHSGCWSQVPGIEEEFAWSCCMNEDRDSRGCMKRIQDGNKLNLSSFNNA